MLESHACFWASSSFAFGTVVMTFIWSVRGIEPSRLWRLVVWQYLAWTYVYFLAGLLFTAAGS